MTERCKACGELIGRDESSWKIGSPILLAALNAWDEETGLVEGAPA